jgi:hypothetical protein
VFRLNPDGRLDTSFASTPKPGMAWGLAMVDDAIVVSGNFDNLQGHPTRRIARLDRDGYLDPLFMPWIGPKVLSEGDGSIRCILPLSDGTLLVTGSFSTYDGVPRRGIARIYGNMTAHFFHNWAVHRDLPVGAEGTADDPGRFGIPNPAKPVPRGSFEMGRSTRLRELGSRRIGGFCCAKRRAFHGPRNGALSSDLTK